MSAFAARTYGRDGDSYGRHALIEPGGGDGQRDVAHVLTRGMIAVGLHPTRFNHEYVGRHRDDEVAELPVVIR